MRTGRSAAAAGNATAAAATTMAAATMAAATARAALASGASGQRGHSMVRAHSASEDARERAGDTRPEPGSSARATIWTRAAKAPYERGDADPAAPNPGKNDR